MEGYSTNGKTLQKVICETKDILDQHKTSPSEKLYYFKKYKDCTAILTNKKTNYYVYCIFDVYGPFKELSDCTKLRRIINIKTEAHHQAMVNSWSEKTFVNMSLAY